MAGITFDHGFKRFGDVTVLNDFDRALEHQEFLVLVGPSGSGKTTALRLLAGLEEISAGTSSIGDRVVNDGPPKDRDIAMVFQSYALDPHLSVYDTMAFGLKLRKTPTAEIAKRVKQAADMLRIGHLLARKPKARSGGQRQRVARGRAIVRNPAVCLIDEPRSNLDATLRVQTRAEIAKLHQRLKTTVVSVPHDQVEALTMGNHIAVMNDGMVGQLATPQALYDHPANRFVAGFIGSPAMNVFAATLDRRDGGAVVDIGSFQLPLPQEKLVALGSQIGKPVFFGIRPEDIHDAQYLPRGVDEAAKLNATVTVVEPLGSEVYAYVANGGKEMVSRLDPRTSARVGQGLDLIVDMAKMHAFERDSGRTLL
jgi:multiple sugar transport system ATP-binding protein